MNKGHFYYYYYYYTITNRSRIHLIHLYSREFRHIYDCCQCSRHHDT